MQIALVNYCYKQLYLSEGLFVGRHQRTVENSTIIQIPGKDRRKTFLHVLNVFIQIMIGKKILDKKLLDELRIHIENAAYTSWLSEKLQEITATMKTNLKRKLLN